MHFRDNAARPPQRRALCRLMQLLRDRLEECGWRDDMEAHARGVLLYIVTSRPCLTCSVHACYMHRVVSHIAEASNAFAFCSSNGPCVPAR